MTIIEIRPYRNGWQELCWQRSIDLQSNAGRKYTGGEVVITVKDTGAGIPAEEIPRIWERLYRGDKSRSQRGLELGLSLVRAIVNAHGGRIELQSDVGKGSSLTSYLANH